MLHAALSRLARCRSFWTAALVVSDAFTALASTLTSVAAVPALRRVELALARRVVVKTRESCSGESSRMVFVARLR